MNLVVYADESGHHDATGNLPESSNPVICGIAGKSGEWSDFCCDWGRILNAYSISYFHFNEWASAAAIARGVRPASTKKVNPYQGISHSRLERLLTSACKLIGSKNFIFVGVSIPLKQNNPIANPNKQLADLFFEKLVSDIRSGRPNWDGGVTVIYDEPDKTWRRAVSDAFYAAKDRWPQLKELTFGSKLDHYGLQAADIAASRFRQLFNQYERGGVYFPFPQYDLYLMKAMFSQFKKHGFSGHYMAPKVRLKPKK